MFRKGSLQDVDMVQVYNTASKWEADIAKKLLEEAGIAALVMDREEEHRDHFPSEWELEER